MEVEEGMEKNEFNEKKNGRTNQPKRDSEKERGRNREKKRK